MRTIFLAVAAIAAPLAATPAFAQDSDSISRSVGYSDLDLASETGQRTLRVRIGRAVTYVCGAYPVGAQPEEIDRLNTCRKSATTDAHRQLAARKGNAILASAYPR